MRSSWLFVQLVLWDSSIWFSFKKQIKSFLFVCDCMLRKSFHCYVSLCVFLECDIISWSSKTFPICGKKIKHDFIINFKVWNLNFKFEFRFCADFLKKFCNRSRDDSSVIEIRRRSWNCESFSASRLTVGKNSSVVSFNGSFYDIINAVFKNFFLRDVM